jgi:hypothetical protein
MQKKLLLVLFILFCTFSIAAQSTNKTTEDSIKQTIQTFFKGMQSKDTGLIRTTLTTSMIMQTIEKSAKGQVQISSEPVEKFFTTLVTLPANIKTLDERIVFEKILIDDAMAMAWTPFELYLNDQFYSCGVNHFQLVKINNLWKINFIIDTRRKICK